MKVFLCPVCKSETEHQDGLYKAVEISGRLFGANSSFTDDVGELSDLFKDYVISRRGGELSLDVLRTFLVEQRSQSGSHPLSRMFARRMRAHKCTNCGHLIQLSRLP